MENIIASIFQVESEGYQAITTLSQQPVTENYVLLQMALVKRQGSSITVCDSFNSGIHTTNDTAYGGLIGGFLGILGGPLGVLFMGSTGALVGSIKDAGDAKASATLMEAVADKLEENAVALIALVQENNESALDAKLGKFQTEIIRYDAAVVADEVEEAKRVQKDLEKKARQELRESKKADRKQAIEEKRAKIKADFDSFKDKFKK